MFPSKVIDNEDPSLLIWAVIMFGAGILPEEMIATEVEIVPNSAEAVPEGTNVIEVPVVVKVLLKVNTEKEAIKEVLVEVKVTVAGENRTFDELKIALNFGVNVKDFPDDGKEPNRRV